MLTKLKKSTSSSNFWNNVGTVVVLAALAIYEAVTNSGSEATVAIIGATVIKNLSNILYHLNKVQNTVISTDLQEK